MTTNYGLYVNESRRILAVDATHAAKRPPLSV